MRLAEVLAREGRVEDARAKYQTLAELSSARGDLERAEGFYRQLLKIAADDVSDRSKLIDILTQQGRMDAAIEEYLELGEGHTRAGQLDKAAEKFGEGVRLAVRSGITNSTAINLRISVEEITPLSSLSAGTTSTVYPNSEPISVKRPALPSRPLPRAKS